MTQTFDIIYFDMDGVLVDFENGVREFCDMDPPAWGAPDHDEKDEIMFERISRIPNFYYKLRPIDGTMEIFNELVSKYGEKVKILTGIPKPHKNVPTASADKVAWVKDYIPCDVAVHTVLRREKMEFAKGPDSILIDDMQKNIDEWVSAGGTGIRFTTPEALRTRLSEMGIL